ncbi:hypothetical protein [Lyngbya aestuarii]|uniref:hypothetical protein n=1 Tax=Lyngbya aestuarii TaxID=118322 RepID=UPI00403D8786
MSYTWNYLQRNQKEAKRLVGISYEQLIQLMDRLNVYMSKNSQKEKEVKLG